jgi:hypothetical protein
MSHGSNRPLAPHPSGVKRPANTAFEEDNVIDSRRTKQQNKSVNLHFPELGPSDNINHENLINSLKIAVARGTFSDSEEHTIKGPRSAHGINAKYSQPGLRGIAEEKIERTEHSLIASLEIAMDPKAFICPRNDKKIHIQYRKSQSRLQDLLKDSEKTLQVLLGDCECKQRVTSPVTNALLFHSKWDAEMKSTAELQTQITGKRMHIKHLQESSVPNPEREADQGAEIGGTDLKTMLVEAKLELQSLIAERKSKFFDVFHVRDYVLNHFNDLMQHYTDILGDLNVKLAQDGVEENESSMLKEEIKQVGIKMQVISLRKQLLTGPLPGL